MDENISRKNVVSTNKENKDNKENKENKENKISNFDMGKNYITLKTKNYNDNISIIEVKLPNPYSDINQLERNKTIEYNIKSKFKSIFSDYLNHSKTHQNSNYNSKLTKNNYIILNKLNSCIHFTKNL